MKVQILSMKDPIVLRNVPIESMKGPSDPVEKLRDDTEQSSERGIHVESYVCVACNPFEGVSLRIQIKLGQNSNRRSCDLPSSPNSPQSLSDPTTPHTSHHGHRGSLLRAHALETSEIHKIPHLLQCAVDSRQIKNHEALVQTEASEGEKVSSILSTTPTSSFSRGLVPSQHL